MNEAPKSKPPGLQPQDFFDLLRGQGVNFFAGVPDSLLKDICAFITDSVDSKSHFITANEGAAIALAAGHHLGTGDLPLVYLQNSGLGNIVNPLLSLTDPEVYRIPMLLMIGWRGEPGKKDEPQHVKQGRVMTALLDAMEIPYGVIDGSSLEQARSVIEQAIRSARQDQKTYALLIRDGAFASYKLKNSKKVDLPLTREAAIQAIADALSPDDLVVSTTGKTSRELYEHRIKKGQGTANDFLTVGSMGHSSQIAMGLALAQPSRQVICLDGDGAVLMHMGSVALQGQGATTNFKHVVLNNGAHDSVGGQPTLGFEVDFAGVFSACGYRWTRSVESPSELADAVRALRETAGPAMLEVRVKKGARDDLGRPKSTPLANKQQLMKTLGFGE